MNQENQENQDDVLAGLASDAWISAVGLKGVYDPCPCGCGKKIKFVAASEKEAETHENNFCQRWKSQVDQVGGKT